MTAVSTAVLSMMKPKLPFSIDALMGNETKANYRYTSPVRDFSMPKSKSESRPQSASPQPILVPIPTFPAPGPSSSRERGVFSSGLYQRTLPHYPSRLEPSLAGMLIQSDPYQGGYNTHPFPWYFQRPRFLHSFGPGKFFILLLESC